MLTGIAHVNLTVPTDTLDEAEAFYSNTLGMQRVPVPVLQKDRLAWYVISSYPSARGPVLRIKTYEKNSRFDITPKGQQIHIAFGPATEESSRHPCFQVESQEALLKLQRRVFEHFEAGGKGAPRAADKPGAENSGMLIYASVRLGYQTDCIDQAQKAKSTPADFLQETMQAIDSSSACKVLSSQRVFSTVCLLYSRLFTNI
jgi:catechol 2,3-dioxygenase-like lactoylglutathione lyase family enzyme